MLWFRSTVYNLLALVWTVLCGGVGLPFLLLLPRPKPSVIVLRIWSYGLVKMARILCGLRYQVLGEVPKGAAIIASKHQSAWETLALGFILSDVFYVLKRELLFLPIIGWYMWGMRCVGIKRSDGKNAIRKIQEQASRELHKGRQLIIFPEGTRVPIGETKPYKSGVAVVYEEANVPVVPVALNSGICWPRNSWKKYPGLITVQFLEPIPPGLPKKEFMELLESRISGGCDALCKN